MTPMTLQGVYRANIHVHPGLWAALSATDRARATHVMSGGLDPADSRVKGRSFTMRLGTPVTVDDMVIRSLRFKGIVPQADADGNVPRHDGDGRVPLPVWVDEAGFAYHQPDPIGSPQGAMSLSRRCTESASALLLGPHRTDLLAGYGEYPDLLYGGEPTAFVSYGMESESDQRFHDMKYILQERHYHSLLLRSQGETMNDMHLRGAHRYPHFGNIGVVMDPLRIRIRDLDTFMSFEGLTREQKYGYRLLDIGTVLGRIGSRYPESLYYFIDGYLDGKSLRLSGDWLAEIQLLWSCFLSLDLELAVPAVYCLNHKISLLDVLTDPRSGRLVPMLHEHLVEKSRGPVSRSS